MSLQGALKEFQFEWSESLSSDTKKKPVLFVRMTKKLALDAEDIVKGETLMWVEEFKSSVADFEKQMKESVKGKKKG